MFFFEICYMRRFVEGSAEDLCRELWRLVDAQYGLRGTLCRLGTIELRFFTDPGRPHQQFPMLTTRVKAAETRALVPIVATIWNSLMNRRHEEDRRIDSMLANLATCYECLDDDSFRLPVRKQRLLEARYERFALDYRWLCWDALRRLALRWHEVPKFHVGFHLVYQSRFMNPRFGW